MPSCRRSAVLDAVDVELGIKHATATASVKPARLETGSGLQVQPFVNTDEKIRVSTDHGSDLECA